MRREDHALVYLVRDDAGGLDKIILPIRGYGLWSTMYGFMALESDGNTVAGRAAPELVRSGVGNPAAP